MIASPTIVEAPRLSICIATYGRGAFIAETLDSIVGQLLPGVELLIVDGASPDDTPEVVSRYVSEIPPVRYYRESLNSGVDGDYDKAVSYARGTYCWLMTDDDLMSRGAIDKVLRALQEQPDLVIVNSTVLSADFSTVLMGRFLDFGEDRVYSGDTLRLFEETCNYLTFIGGVVVRRSLWLERERKAYFGTAFIHVGVLFQRPIDRCRVVAEPLVQIRYGNAMWTSRGFEIWMIRWPALVWSFDSIADASKERVTPREPWRQFRRLVYSRAIGSYSLKEFTQHLKPIAKFRVALVPLIVAAMPGWVANTICGAYCLLVNRNARSTAYDLARSRHSSWVGRRAARSLGV